jgi:FkbM family methyltransferase
MTSLLNSWRAIFKILPEKLKRIALRYSPPGVKTIDVILPGGQVLIFNDLFQSEILKKITWKGFQGYEYDTVKLFYHLAKKSEIIFDIGSYFGYYSLIASRANPISEIHSFEPVPMSIELQKQYIKLNQIRNIQVHEVAIGKLSGEAIFFLPSKSLSRIPNIGSLKNRFIEGEIFSDRIYTEHNIKVTTLIDFVKNSNIKRIDLIKIDTEETEFDIISSSIDLLSKFKPDIIMEILPKSSTASSVYDILRSIGYNIFVINHDSLLQCHNITPDNLLKYFQIKQKRNFGEFYCTFSGHNDPYIHSHYSLKQFEMY